MVIAAAGWGAEHVDVFIYTESVERPRERGDRTLVHIQRSKIMIPRVIHQSDESLVEGRFAF